MAEHCLNPLGGAYSILPHLLNPLSIGEKGVLGKAG